MDKKTRLTGFIPELMDDWNKYKKGLKGLKITNWCISSDYCFDNPNKLDVAAFTVFPLDYGKKIYYDINENLPHDIKETKHFTEKELNYLKNSKYFFTFSIILYNVENYFDKEKSVEQITRLLKSKKEDIPYEINNEDFHDGKEKLQEFFNNIKKKNCSQKKLSKVYFVAQFVAQLMEFLIIKEKSKTIGWCPDRGHIDSFNHGIIYNLVQIYIHRIIRNRVTDFQLLCPPPDNQDNKICLRDAFIRIPDIIAGALASLIDTEKGLTTQLPKHCEIINQCLGNNHKMINLIYDFNK